MEAPRSRTPRIVGILLLIALPVCVLAAGAYAYYQPRMFSASTRFELLRPQTDGPQIQETFRKAQEMIGKYPPLHLPFRSSVTQASSSSQFTVTAIDGDPLLARDAANSLTLFISNIIRDAGKDESRPLKIVEKAVMPAFPSYPDVRLIMQLGIYSGLVLAAVGIFFLRVSRARRALPEPGQSS